MRGWLWFFLSTVLVSCSFSETLNIFIIPHSHCDPGWLQTFEGYFTTRVDTILTSVTESLLSDPNRKFSWAEISFFHRWWIQQSNETREEVQHLIKNGQLEFVAGGWVQNDEANANFDIVIDQVTEGHHFLNETFGVVPRIAWQIDPFGHSSVTPSLFARMGFEALVINRIHFGLKDSFKKNKTMEFLWTGSSSLGNSSEIFTHVLHSHYSAPSKFDWERNEYGTTPINANNVASRAGDLVSILQERAKAYKTNNLLVPFGDDFKFQNADIQFDNMDQLIKEINANTQTYNVRIQYATVSEYFDAITTSSTKEKIQFPAYYGDFFPYADNDDAYWTGYYTSRPVLKDHSRGTDSMIRAAEGLYALARSQTAHRSDLQSAVNWTYHFDGLQNARRDAALVQHHDGITGTARQAVVEDYTARLNQARKASVSSTIAMAQILLTADETPSLTYGLTNFSFAQGNEVYAIIVHNPLAWVRRKYVKVVVTAPDVAVTSSQLEPLKSQIMPIFDLDDLTANEARFELYFLVEVPPLGLQTFFLGKATTTKPEPSEHAVFQRNFPDSLVAPLTVNSTIHIENEHIRVKYNGLTALIQSVENKDSSNTLNLNQELVDYTTAKSGAYIMRTLSDDYIYKEQTPIKLIKISGPLVSQICSYFYSKSNRLETSVCARVFSTGGIVTPNALEIGGYIEVTYSVVGRLNKETVARFNTGLPTNRVFYTDNGLEIKERKGSGSRAETSYYPNLSFAYLQDTESDVQFSIISRHAMGTHSKANGTIEQMLHRALAQDDNRGLSEPNRDESRLEVMVYLMVQPLEPSVRMGRRLALSLQHEPRYLHAEVQGGQKAWGDRHKLTYYPLSQQLPHNVHLLSFKARDCSSDYLMLRLLHIFEVGQHATYSQPKTVKLNDILLNFDFGDVQERSLAMSLDVDAAQARRYQYNISGVLHHSSGSAPQFVKQESQNTDEEGVWISEAALEENQKQDNQDKQNKQDKQDKEHKASARAARSVLSDDVRARNDIVKRDATTVLLEPMQIKSYFVRLLVKQSKHTTPTHASTPPVHFNESSDLRDIDGSSMDTMSTVILISMVGTALLVHLYLRKKRRATAGSNGGAGKRA